MSNGTDWESVVAKRHLENRDDRLCDCEGAHAIVLEERERCQRLAQQLEEERKSADWWRDHAIVQSRRLDNTPWWIFWSILAGYALGFAVGLLW